MSHREGNDREHHGAEAHEVPDEAPGPWQKMRDRALALLGQSQHRNTYFLTLNTVTNAGVGVLFWLVLARLFGLPPSDIGIGYSIVSLGTIAGVLGKAGFDTALLRNVPLAGRSDGLRLLGFSIFIGGLIATTVAVIMALSARGTGILPDLGAAGWFLVAGIGGFLVVTWLQDAWFLAEKDARATFHRNLVFSAGRLLLPVPILFLALPSPVALTWGLALVLSAAAAILFRVEGRERPERRVSRRVFLRSAWRNVSGSAAEFLPGMILAPIVLAVSGADAAAYFGIAWTGAMVLFLVSAAVSRSALTEMVGHDAAQTAAAVRRGAKQLVWLIAPAAVIGILFAPYLLGIFGPGYAEEGSTVFTVLAVSTLFVAPSYLYLGVLRAHERAVGLVVFPAAMLVLLLVLAPLFGAHAGPVGVAAAWFVANAPFGMFAAWRLYREARTVSVPRGAMGHPSGE